MSSIEEKRTKRQSFIIFSYLRSVFVVIFNHDVPLFVNVSVLIVLHCILFTLVLTHLIAEGMAVTFQLSYNEICARL